MADGFDGDTIYSYSRAQAIADGDLVDVTDTAREAGFTYPVAVTRAAWNEAVEWNPRNRGLQDEAGRLWDVVYMAGEKVRVARRAGRADESRLDFELWRVPNTRMSRLPKLITLSVVVGPGDQGEPVVTIMCTHED